MGDRQAALSARTLAAFTSQHGPFLLFSVLLCAAFAGPLFQLAALSMGDKHYSHIALIPFISLYLVFTSRGAIFSLYRKKARSMAAALLVPGALAVAGAQLSRDYLNQIDYLSLVMAAFVVFILAGFIFCYGTASFGAGAFPLLLLFFMVPVPSSVLERIIYGLQVGSTWATAGVFQLTGVPVYQEGFFFTIPGLTIHVAEECSGIRSSTALVIAGLLAGHLLLRSWWSRTFLIAVIVPLTMFKNGVRIVSLSLLCVYVDRGFLYGGLHTRGGLLFFVLALLMLAPVLFGLRAAENRLASDSSKMSPHMGAALGSPPEGGRRELLGEKKTDEKIQTT